MATTKPRINVALDSESFQSIEALAERRGCSLSEMVRILVLDMLELNEDRALAEAASVRRRTLKGAATLTHEQVFGRRRGKRA
jgi:hypothetical protein